MTARELDHAALADHTVIALIPATPDYESAPRPREGSYCVLR